jgi:HEAT repeat protein
VFTATASFAHVQEMMWDGKTVSQWIKLANDPTPATREHAANVLGYFGNDARPALPVLKKLLDDKDPGVREAAGRALDNVTAALSRRKPAVQGNAAEVFQHFAANLERIRTSGTLEPGHADPKATTRVADLVKTLADPYPNSNREAAVTALKQMGAAAKPAVPALMNLLDNPDWQNRQSAAEVLGTIGPDAKAAVPKLMKLLADPHGPSLAQRSRGRLERSKTNRRGY